MRSLTLGSALALASLATAAPSLTHAQAADPAQFTQAANTDKPDEVLDWNLSAGGVFASGNTRSWTLNAGTAFKLVRGRHGFSLTWGLAYGRADLTPNDDATDYEDTVRNSNARARYDFYLTKMDALFAAVAHRWDTFAGLDTRLQGQVGYLRNIFAEENHRLWGEVGYDLTWDNFDPDPLLDPDDPTIVLDGTQIVHAARGYLGYDNQLNENVHFTTGVEALFNLQEGRDVRVNFDAALQASLIGSLSLELKFKMLFDNVPVPGKVETDTLTTVNLVYTLVHDDAPTAEEGAEE
ncbi:MAG: DUF481 domain-containing protein [Deltaproteobacteria bacterium]|nr:DUF481 domain-containing protein [Deltaproteobacteria bacterium]